MIRHLFTRPPRPTPREFYCDPCEPGGDGVCTGETFAGHWCGCPCQLERTIGDVKTWHRLMHAGESDA